MPQKQLNRDQQKLVIKKQIDLAKKALGELNAAFSSLERGFVAGTVPDSYYVGSNIYGREAERTKTILSWPLRSMFAPVVYHGGMVERIVTNLAFDIFPPDLADQFLSNRDVQWFKTLVRESRDREQYQKSKSYP